MTTRADLRAAVRLRLADANGGALWDDATLNDFLAEALRDYGTRFPREQSLTVNVAAGATSVAITPSIERHQVVRVFDPTGSPVPRQQGCEQAGSGQAWDWWNSTLRLTAPAACGTWRVDYLESRSLPGDDVTPVELPGADEAIVVTLPPSRCAAGPLKTPSSASAGDRTRPQRWQSGYSATRNA